MILTGKSGLLLKIIKIENQKKNDNKKHADGQAADVCGEKYKEIFVYNTKSIYYNWIHL